MSVSNTKREMGCLLPVFAIHFPKGSSLWSVGCHDERILCANQWRISRNRDRDRDRERAQVEVLPNFASATNRG